MRGDSGSSTITFLAILEFVEKFFLLQGAGENAPLRTSPDTGTEGIIEQLKALEKDLGTMGILGLREADLKGKSTIGHLAFKLEVKHRKGENLLNGYVNQLCAALNDVFKAVKLDAELVEFRPIEISSEFVRFSPPDLVQPPLPPEVNDFLDEAAECWRVGFYQGTVLLVLLATEVLTRYYYKCQRADAQLENLSWGQVVGNLDDSEIKGRLDLLVKEYRNQVMHGRLQVDESLAVLVVGICAEVSEDMIHDLLERRLIRCPPDSEEINTVLMMVGTIGRETNRQELAYVLHGSNRPSVRDAGWDALPDFGAFAAFTLDEIYDKLGWCEHNGLIRYYHNYHGEAVVDYADEDIKRQAEQLWTERLLPIWEEWRDTEDIEQVGQFMNQLRNHIKHAFLKRIAKDKRDDFELVLRAWYPYSRGKIARAINHTIREDLQLQPVSRLARL
jgi:hypothetical protein